MKYYFCIDYNQKSKNYLKPASVHRVYRNEEGEHPEMWDGKDWVWCTDVIAANRIGGDDDYQKTTEENAMEFIRRG